MDSTNHTFKTNFKWVQVWLTKIVKLDLPSLTAARGTVHSSPLSTLHSPAPEAMRQVIAAVRSAPVDREFASSASVNSLNSLLQNTVSVNQPVLKRLIKKRFLRRLTTVIIHTGAMAVYFIIETLFQWAYVSTRSEIDFHIKCIKYGSFDQN